MRTRFTAPPGASLQAIGLQTGFARGIEIDNPSGSWLYLPSIQVYVPPYTNGWASSFPAPISSIDVIAQNGPAGQVSTTQGDPIIVYLNDNEVDKSSGAPTPGTPFIEGFTPVSTAFVTGFLNSQTPTGLTTLVAGTAGKRIRLWMLDVGYTESDPSQGLYQDSPCAVTLEDNLGLSNVYAFVALRQGTPSQTRNYPQGLDYPIGEDVVFGGGADWADVAVNVSVTYSVI